MTRVLRTPAKVNLALLVGPPGGDGYHPLLTVYEPIDLYDELEFQLSAHPPDVSGRGRSVAVECPDVDPVDNLVSHALRAVESETGWLFSGRVRVRKGVPIGAGLGGGSSDAALTLLHAGEVMAEAGGPLLDESALRAMALKLGADVPFFLEPRSCLATGIGERLSPLALPDLPLVLVPPDEELSTAEVYMTYDGVASAESLRAFSDRCRRVESAWRTLEQAWGLGDLTLAGLCVQAAGLLHNDLERASLHLLPELGARLSAITHHGALAAAMSGSGPSLFGLCASFEEAERLADRLAAAGVPARPVRAGSAA